MQQYFVSDDKSLLDTEMIIDYLSNRSYWAKGRTSETMETAIQNSFCFGVYTASGQQIAFARVVSDLAVLAWLMDVFVLEEYRGQGIGKMLIGEIFNHPSFKNLKRWALATSDAHDLYRKFGFTDWVKPENLMQKVTQ